MQTILAELLVPTLMESWTIPGILESISTIFGILGFILLKVKLASIWDKIRVG